MGSGCSQHAKVVAGDEPAPAVTEGKPEVVTPGAAIVETPGAPVETPGITPGEPVQKVDHAALQNTELGKPTPVAAATTEPAKKPAKLAALSTMSPLNDAHGSFANTPPNALSNKPKGTPSSSPRKCNINGRKRPSISEKGVPGAPGV